MKKLFALLLAVVLVLGLVACAPATPDPTTDNNTTAGGNDNTTAGGSDNTTAGKTEVGVTFPLAEEITINFLTNTFKNDTLITDWNATLEGNKTWQKLYEMTNIKVNIVHCEDLNTLNGLIQANGSFDIISVNGITGLASSSEAISDLVATEELLAIEEYVMNEKVMPNYLKNVHANLPQATGSFTHPDGHIYVLGYYNADMSGYLESSCWINKTWLEKAGMTIDDVSTLAGLEEFFDWIMKNDPNGNGEQDELPYLCYPSGGYMIEALLGMWGMPTKDGTNENYVALEDGVVTFVPQTEAYKDFLTTMAKWYDEGWMYQGYLNGTAGTAYADCFDTYRKNNGNPDRVAFYTGTGALDRVTATGENDLHPDKDNKCEYVSILPPTVEGYETRWYIHPGYMGTKGALAVSARTEYPAEVCAWIDLFYSEEISAEVYYGAEDSGWVTVDADGKISASTGLDDDAKKKLLNEDKDSYLNFLISSLPYAITQNMYDNVLTQTDAMKKKADALKNYEDVITDEVWPRPYIDVDDNAELSEIRGDIMSVVNEYRANVIAGKKNLTSDWDAFQKTLTESVETERMIEIMQDAYDTWLSTQG